MLDPAVKELAQGANNAVVTTVMPSGALQSTITWIDADDEHLLLNCEITRQRVRNVERDPRITVMIIPDGNWWNVAEVRGRVVEIRAATRRANTSTTSARPTPAVPTPSRSSRSASSSSSIPSASASSDAPRWTPRQPSGTSASARGSSGSL